MAALASGTVAGQLILAASTPFLSRLYSPESFGAFSALLAIATAVGPAAALKYDAGLLLPRSVDDARLLLRLAVLSGVTTALLAAGATAGLQLTPIGEPWRSIPLAPLWSGLMVLSTALFTSLTQAALRETAYGVIARRSPIQSIGTALSQVGLGLLAPNPLSLIGGHLFGRCLGFVPMARASRGLLTRPGHADYGSVIREYWRLPAILAPSALLNAVGSQGPLLFVAAWFGSSMAGQMGMAQRLVFIPAALFGTTLAQVFGAELAKRVRESEGGLRSYYVSLSVKIAGVAALTALAIGVASPWAFPLLLGDSWSQSGLVAQALSVSVGFGLIASPLSQVYQVFQSPLSLAIDASRIVLLGLSVAASIALDLDLVQACWVIAVGQSINYVATWWFGLRIITREDSK